MKCRVEITAAALADVDETYRWYFDRSPEAAEKWRTRLLSAVSKLENNPRRYPVAPESAFVNVEIRELHFGRRTGVYRVLFTIDNNIVYVVHIRHAARDAINLDDLIRRVPPTS